MNFELTDSPIDPHALCDAVRNPAAGGFASFEGWVRNHHQGRDVASLEYEAFPSLAEKKATVSSSKSVLNTTSSPLAASTAPDTSKSGKSPSALPSPLPIAMPPLQPAALSSTHQVHRSHLEKGTLHRWHQHLGQMPLLRTTRTSPLARSSFHLHIAMAKMT